MILKWNRNSSREQDNHLLKPDNDRQWWLKCLQRNSFFFCRHDISLKNMLLSQQTLLNVGGMQQVLQVFPRQYPTFCHVCSSPTATSPFSCKKLWTLMTYFIIGTLQSLIISQNSNKICKAVASIKLSKTYLA